MSKRRSKLELKEEERARLDELIASRKTERRLVEMTQVTKRYAEGQSIKMIMGEVGLSHPSVGKWIDRALAQWVGIKRAPPEREQQLCALRATAQAVITP